MVQLTHMIEGKVVFEGTHKGVTLTVRHVRRDDVERLLSFINTLSAEQTFITFQGEKVSLEEESRYVEGFIQKVENHLAVKLLVFHEGNLIGVGDIITKEKVEKHIGVFGLTIAMEWRKKGIGSLLMKLVMEEAERNIPTMQFVTLGVFGNNPIAKKLYEKMGFREYGMLPKGIQHKGELVDHIYMYRELPIN